jgi:hypothetical protein
MEHVEDSLQNTITLYEILLKKGIIESAADLLIFLDNVPYVLLVADEK